MKHWNYSYFGRACQVIKSVHNTNPEGYKNYMKYWAKNGSYDWICNTSEYAGYTGDVTVVKNTYLVTNFWNNFDGTRSPVNGNTLTTKANGWE